MRALRLVWAFAWALPACASTAGASSADASREAAVDASDGAADGATGACVWRAGEVRTVPATGARCVLHDVIRTGATTSLLRACTDGAGADARWRYDLVSLDALGRAGVTTALADGRAAGARTASLARDPMGRVRALIPGPEGAVGELVRVDGTAVLRTSLTQPMGTFPVTDAHGLVAYGDGFSCVAEEVRGAWGVAMLSLDATGVVRTGEDLGLPISPSVFARVPWPGNDGTFAMLWFDPRGTTGLTLRRYSPSGAPRTEAGASLDLAVNDPIRAVLLPDGDGALLVWEAVADTLPPLGEVATRRLDAQGVPRSEMLQFTELGFYAGGLDATVAQGTRWITAVTGSGVLRLGAYALDDAGALTPLRVPLTTVGAINARARIVETDAGALVVFARDASSLAAVPLTCDRSGRP